MSSRLRAIEYTLDGFLKRCKEARTILEGAPLDSRLDRIRKELDQMISHLMIAKREAKSQGSFMLMNRANTVSRNQQERYRGIQSISSIEGNINRINKKASDVELALFDLLAKMDVKHPLAAIGLAASNQVEKFTEAQVKGEKYERDAIDVADHIGGSIVIIIALGKLAVDTLRSRVAGDKEQPQGQR